ncbi:MAG TPA: hypothetical protein VGF97_11390 [Rhizomicrobium sp.]
MKRVVLSWSGGKDCCLALDKLRQGSDLEVVGLLTTLTGDFDRVSMHGVRRAILERQAERLGLPLHIVEISHGAGNEEYESQTARALEALRDQGITAVVFGDLFLRDVRLYRERMLAPLALEALFPLWGMDTRALLGAFIDRGYRAVIVCVDPSRLAPSFAGRVIDATFADSLPDSVDPCGENGEFHTFVFDGPLFRAPVEFVPGHIVCRDSFWFCDLLPRGE